MSWKHSPLICDHADFDFEEDDHDDLFGTEEDFDEKKLQKAATLQEDVAVDFHMLNAANRAATFKALHKFLLQTLNGMFDDGEANEAVDELVNHTQSLMNSVCYVRRRIKGPARLAFEKQRNISERKKAGGSGTLVILDGEVVVLTNNHVIMDSEEAATGMVVFDHFDDFGAGASFQVPMLEVLWSSPRKPHKGDNLDLTVIRLSPSPDLQSAKLRQRAGPSIINSLPTFMKMCAVTSVSIPMICLSFPRGLAMRISWGVLPNEQPRLRGDNANRSPNPVAPRLDWLTKTVWLLDHVVPTRTGSSGSVLLVPNAAARCRSWCLEFLHFASKSAPVSSSSTSSSSSTTGVNERIGIAVPFDRIRHFWRKQFENSSRCQRCRCVCAYGKSFKQCGLCGIEYCSKICQRNDWRKHKPLCVQASTVKKTQRKSEQ